MTERYYRIRVSSTGTVSGNATGVIRLDSCSVSGQSKLFGLPIQPYAIAMGDLIGWQLGGGTGSPNADIQKPCP